MSAPAGADRRALLALVTGAVLIGLAPIFVRLTEVGPTATGFWRAALALPLLALFLPRRGTAPAGRTGLHLLLLAGLCFGGDLTVWHRSIHYTTVANATLMANIAPVFVTLAAFVFFGERFRRSFIAGLGLALLGATVLVSGSLRIGPESVKGDLLGLAAAVFYAGYLMLVSRARSRALNPYSAGEVMFWTTFAMAVLLLPLSVIGGETLWPQTAQGWAVLAGLALLSHGAGQGLIAYALAHLPAAFSAVGLLVQPLAAAIFAWALLAEPLGARQAAGAAIVLAGILICRRAVTAPSGETTQGRP